jgi:hypothetical protein
MQKPVAWLRALWTISSFAGISASAAVAARVATTNSTQPRPVPFARSAVAVENHRRRFRAVGCAGAGQVLFSLMEPLPSGRLML